MNKYKLISSGFSLIELLIVIAIVGILLSIGIPSYNQYIIKAKMLEVFTLADAHKLKVIEEIMYGYNADEINNNVINDPNKLVTKLEYFVNHQEKQYMFKITPNIQNLGIKLLNNVPLVVEFKATQELENNMISWNCQYTKGYSDFMPKNCKDNI
ncbi:MAG: pilin [Gammaproteobacteria bacterium]